MSYKLPRGFPRRVRSAKRLLAHMDVPVPATGAQWTVTIGQLPGHIIHVLGVSCTSVALFLPSPHPGITFIDRVTNASERYPCTSDLYSALLPTTTLWRTSGSNTLQNDATNNWIVTDLPSTLEYTGDLRVDSSFVSLDPSNVFSAISVDFEYLPS